MGAEHPRAVVGLFGDARRTRLDPGAPHHPAAGRLDLSFLVVIIVLQLVDSNIVQAQRYTACFFQ